jgi:CheY-like chemotaxis protein
LRVGDMVCKILIVEDYDGGEALDRLAEIEPDLILLDIILDEMMGDDLFRQIKQMPEYADLPVIIVSVLPESRVRELLELDPRTLFLRKPFRREQLLEAIRRNLNARDQGGV